MQIPVTHYEVMRKDTAKYLGVTIDELTQVIGGDFDFLDLKDYVESHPTFLYIYRQAGEEQLNMAVRMMYHIARMRLHGEKIYHLTSSVCDVIHSTKPTIDAEFIEAPFEDIYLSLEQNRIIMTDGIDEAPMKGLYISLRKEKDGIKKLRFLSTSAAKMDELKDVNHFAVFNIPEHGNLEEIFAEQAKIFKAIPGANPYVTDQVIYDIFKFAVGCLLYIGCRNANLLPIKPFTIEEAVKGKGQKKAKIIARRMQKVSQSPFTYVTHNWSNGGSSSSGGSGRKLDHEVLVAGYWRGQWYGSEKTGDRRKEVIRVNSYTKGGGERKSKKYVVK